MFLEIFEYSSAEIKGTTIQKLVFPEERDILQKIKGQDSMEGSAPSGYELKCLTKSGRVIWALWKGATIKYKDKAALLISISDISKLKHVEIALRESENRLRFLSSQLLTTQEKERSRLARELHDELGQSLSFLKLQFRAIERNLHPEELHYKEDCQNLLAYVDEIITNVRRISRQLSVKDQGYSPPPGPR